MSTLGKILVVLNLIFAIAYAVISAVLYTQRVDYKSEIQKMKGEREAFLDFMTKKKYRSPAAVSETGESLANYRPAVDTVHTDFQTSKSAHLEEVSRLKSQISTRDDEIAKLTNDLKKAVSDAEIAENKAREADNRLSTMQNIIQNLTQRADQLEQQKAVSDEKLREAQGKYDELYVRNVELNERASRFDEELQLAKEDIKHLQDRSDRLKALLDQAARVCPGVFAENTGAAGPAEEGGGQAQKIRGQILGVREPLKLVVIDRGAAHGVKSGTEFIVHRGSDYVGRIQVEKVFEDNSTARVTVRRLEIRQGDSVTNRLD